MKPPADPTIEWLTVAEAAAKLRVSESLIRSAIKNKELRATPYGVKREGRRRPGTYRIRAKDLDRYQAERETVYLDEPEPAPPADEWKQPRRSFPRRSILGAPGGRGD